MMPTTDPYRFLLDSHFGKTWKRVGTHRRAGVSVPLFSVYSKNSVGIGEIPDLKLLIDWCAKTGLSILQLFPMNDTGFNFRPYDADSSFAIDPVYLSLEELSGVPKASMASRIDSIRKRFPTATARVDYGVKRAKLELLKQVFDGIAEPLTLKRFSDFRAENRFWLEGYARFRALKERFFQSSWTEWPQDLPELPQRELLFYEWLQWQLYEQFTSVKRYAKSQKVLLKGDLPFLVSWDSADVWCFRDCFKLDRVSGAPPDLYFAKGQRWGMPPYDWGRIAARGYDYLIRKLKFSENFYDLFRIDHFIGVFRIWTIAIDQPREDFGYHGAFDPPDTALWEEHGRRILFEMTRHTSMLPCAEDLGAVPECSDRTLKEFGIPGMNVQRWMRDWDRSWDFIDPSFYRPYSVAAVSTHDMPALVPWWIHEAGTIDEAHFRLKCLEMGLDPEPIVERLFDAPEEATGRLFWKPDIDGFETFRRLLGVEESKAWAFDGFFRSSFDERERFWKLIGLPGRPARKGSSRFVEKVLEAAGRSASIFSIQLMQDWLSLDPRLPLSGLDCRINVPGTMNEHNWSIRIPVSLERLLSLKINASIHALNRHTDRS